MKKHKFSNGQIDEMNTTIQYIIDNYLIDLYGELNEDAKSHVYTVERIKLLMMSAYHAGYSGAINKD